MRPALPPACSPGPGIPNAQPPQEQSPARVARLPSNAVLFFLWQACPGGLYVRCRSRQCTRACSIMNLPSGPHMGGHGPEPTPQGQASPVKSRSIARIYPDCCSYDLRYLSYLLTVFPSCPRFSTFRAVLVFSSMACPQLAQTNIPSLFSPVPQ